MITAPRVLLTALLAAAVTLSGCTSDGAGKGTSSGSPSASGTALPSGTAGSTGTKGPSGQVSGGDASGNPGAPSSGAGSPGPGGVSGANGGSGGPPARPVPSSPLRSVTIQGQTATYPIKIWAQVRDTACYQHAYGNAVIDYLTVHPCRGMTRLLATTTVNGRTVGIAQSTVSFDGVSPKVYQTAGNFQALLTKDGSGNLRDLFREGYRLPSGPTAVPSPDAFKALTQDATVAAFDVWYLSGPTPANDPPLTTMVEQIFLQY